MQTITSSTSLSFSCSTHNLPHILIRSSAGAMARLSNLAIAVAVMLALAMVAQVQGQCNILALRPCLEAAKGAAAPDATCCSAVKAMGTAAGGPQCLCSLATSSAAKANGVTPDAAMAIPAKCNLPVPKGFMCNNKPVPGS